MTAYDMRISTGSSVVCSSDLAFPRPLPQGRAAPLHSACRGWRHRHPSPSPARRAPPQRALHLQLGPGQRHGDRGDQRARERRRQPPLQPPLSPPHWGARRPHASRHLSRQRDHRPVRRRPRATLLVQERAPPLAPSTLRQPALMGSMLRRASPFSHSLWRREIRATLLLAYPLILTNLAQAAIHATDIILLGWVGPRTLAAGALGVNLFNACLIFGLGLVTASAPMMAPELGRFRPSVRDVRRKLRRGSCRGRGV